MDSTPTFTNVVPILAVRDLTEAIEYYRDALGFHHAWTWMNGRAGMSRDGFEVQLVSDGMGPSGPSVVYIHVRDVDRYYGECVKLGALISAELADREFGLRDFRVLDHSGNRLGFGEPLLKKP